MTVARAPHYCADTLHIPADKAPVANKQVRGGEKHVKRERGEEGNRGRAEVPSCANKHVFVGGPGPEAAFGGSRLHACSSISHLKAFPFETFFLGPRRPGAHSRGCRLDPCLFISMLVRTQEGREGRGKGWGG